MYLQCIFTHSIDKMFSCWYYNTRSQTLRKRDTGRRQDAIAIAPDCAIAIAFEIYLIENLLLLGMKVCILKKY